MPLPRAEMITSKKMHGDFVESYDFAVHFFISEHFILKESRYFDNVRIEQAYLNSSALSAVRHRRHPVADRRYLMVQHLKARRQHLQFATHFPLRHCEPAPQRWRGNPFIPAARLRLVSSSVPPAGGLPRHQCAHWFLAMTGLGKCCRRADPASRFLFLTEKRGVCIL